jgi:hypothetical protein
LVGRKIEVVSSLKKMRAPSILILKMPILTYKQFHQLRRLQNALCRGDSGARLRIEALCRRLKQDTHDWLLFDESDDMADVREYQVAIKECLQVDRKIAHLEHIKNTIEELEEIL